MIVRYFSYFFRNYLEEQTSTATNLQIGIETEVTAGVNTKAIISSEKLFKQAWGNSEKFKGLKEEFNENQAMLVSSMARCTVYEIQLKENDMPKLTTNFIDVIARLYMSRNKTTEQKKKVFRQFIREFGTHYMMSASMGASHIYQTMFRIIARTRLSVKTLET